jgi:hypothetical protein
MEEGVGFLDTAALRTGPVGTKFLNAYLYPATGPVAGGTQLQIPSSANLDALYFGKNLASSVSQIGNGLFEATTPPGSPGYVDVYGMMTDGGMQILPEARSAMGLQSSRRRRTPRQPRAEEQAFSMAMDSGLQATVQSPPICKS